MAFQHLHMDYETRSLVDLKEVGIDNYAKHPSTQILICCWALDREEVETWLPHLGPPPKKLLDALRDPAILKIAWNSSFEYNITRYVLTRMIGTNWFVPLEQFRDPIILAHHISLPGKLEDVAKILKMKELKDDAGKDLIDQFSYPVSMGGEMTLFGMTEPLFRDYNSHPREFEAFAKYCKQDVVTERDLWYRMNKIPLPEIEWQGWLLDQKINEFGMPGNREMAEKALRIAERFIDEKKTELKQKTGLANPNSDTQMKEWLSTRGYAWNSLNAKYVQLEMDNPESKLTPEARDVLEIRKDARKSSYTKLRRFLSMLSEDDRLRWQFKYMGAPRTGRWSSGKTDGTDSAVQVQNMSRGEGSVIKKLDRALALIMAEDYDGIIKEFFAVPDKKKAVTPVTLVITLLRSLFQAKPGKILHMVDKNAIENRMLGWAAGCDAILNVFRTCNTCGYLVHDLDGPFSCPKCGCTQARCPYLSFGTQLYNKSYEEMWAAYAAGYKEDRQNSKPPVLGGGYGMSGGEMYTNENGDEVRGGLWGYAKNVCGVDMPKELAHKAVAILRATWPEVVTFWYDLEEAFKQVLGRGGKVRVGEVTWSRQQREWVEHPTKGKQCVIEFTRLPMEGGGWIIRMLLPSGRALHYINATVENIVRKSKKTGKPYTLPTIFYDGVEHSATEDASGARAKRKLTWGRVTTTGGKICENAIQALSRDDFLNSMFLADDIGFHIWGLYHDEIACEEDKDDMFGLRLSDLVDCMSAVPKWAPGLLLGAEGFSSPVYKKG
jgi:DNA polymerase bacteriophage-type